MVSDYLPMVRRISWRYARRTRRAQIEDLISAGCIGLLEAMAHYDPDKGVTFARFAEFRIAGAILDDLRSMDPMPRRSRKQLQDQKRAYRQLTIEKGRPPEPDQVAERLGITLDDFWKFERLNEPRDPIARQLHQLPADELFSREETRYLLARFVSELPDRLKRVIMLYYHGNLIYKQISSRIGVTESAICQMHKRAIGILRGRLALTENPNGSNT